MTTTQTMLWILVNEFTCKKMSCKVHRIQVTNVTSMQPLLWSLGSYEGYYFLDKELIEALCVCVSVLYNDK